MFSTLYARKVAADGDVSIKKIALTKANILDTFDDLMTAMDEAEVPLEGRVLYLTPTVRRVLKAAEGLSRSMSVQNNNGEIDRRVARLDEV